MKRQRLPKGRIFSQIKQEPISVSRDRSLTFRNPFVCDNKAVLAKSSILSVL